MILAGEVVPAKQSGRSRYANGGLKGRAIRPGQPPRLLRERADCGVLANETPLFDFHRASLRAHQEAARTCIPRGLGLTDRGAVRSVPPAVLRNHQETLLVSAETRGVPLGALSHWPKQRAEFRLQSCAKGCGIWVEKSSEALGRPKRAERRCRLSKCSAAPISLSHISAPNAFSDYIR